MKRRIFECPFPYCGCRFFSKQDLAFHLTTPHPKKKEKMKRYRQSDAEYARRVRLFRLNYVSPFPFRPKLVKGALKK